MKNIQVFLTLFAVASIQAIPASEKQILKYVKDDSPRGRFVDIEGLKYFVSDADEVVNQTTAFQRCNELGMRLVSYDSVKKHAQLESYFSTDALYPFWTSGAFYGSNQWLWRGSGILFTSTSPGWMQGEPQYAWPGDVNCVIMQQLAGWDAESCYDSYPYVCEPLCTTAK